MVAELWKDTLHRQRWHWKVCWSYLLGGVLENSNYHAMCSLSRLEVCSFLIGHCFLSRDRSVLLLVPHYLKRTGLSHQSVLLSQSVILLH